MFLPHPEIFSDGFKVGTPTMASCPTGNTMLQPLEWTSETQVCQCSICVKQIEPRPNGKEEKDCAKAVVA